MTGSIFMLAVRLPVLLPLQSITNFALDDVQVTFTDILIGVGVFAAIVGALILVNSFSKKAPAASGKSKSSGADNNKPNLFSFFAMRRIAHSLGLNREQSKMLDYIFKTDSVTDPERSINTPVLLDRHFRKSYKIIEKSPGTEKEIQHKLSILFSTRNTLENSLLGVISSTQQLKENVSLIINYEKEKLNIHVRSTRGDNIVVEAPKTVLGSLIKIPRGTKLKAMFFTKNNKGFSFETRVLGFSGKDGSPTMQLAHSHQLKFLSQRRFRRRQAAIACNLFLVYVEGSGKKQRLLVDKRHLPGNIADISVGGCSIKAMAPVQVGARFKIEFTQGEHVATLGQVLRTNRAGSSTIIHVRFLRVSQKSMNIINAFVYEYGNE